MKFEFIHDTIANVVSKKASADSKIRKQLRSMVERAHQRYLDKGILLTKDDLEEIRPFQNQIDFSEGETKFIKKSRQAISRKRRRNQFLIAAFITALIIALLMVIGAQQKTAASEKKALDANKELNATNATLDNKIDELNQSNTSLEEARANLLAREDSLKIAIDLAQKNERAALKAKNEALFQKSRALKGENIAEARRIASLAQLIGREGKLNDALKMCVVAAKKTPSIQPEVYQALQGVWLEDEEQKVPIRNEKLRFNVPYTSSVAASPTGDTLAIALFGSTTQLRSKDGKLLHNFSEISNFIDELIFSPDGKYLFAKSHEETSYLWSLKEHRMLATIPAQKDFTRRTAAFSANSKILALTKGTKALIYDVEKGELVSELSGGTSNLIHLSFSPNGKYLASTDNTKWWMLWDVQKQELVRKNAEVELVSALKFAPDSQSFVLASGDIIYEYSLNGELLNEIGADYSVVDDIQFSKDGKRLAVLLDYGAILLYSSGFKEKKKISKFISTQEISFSKDGNYLWANGFDGTFKINLDGQEIFAVPFKTYLSRNVISPAEDYVLSINKDGQYDFWEPFSVPIEKAVVEQDPQDDFFIYNTTFGLDKRQIFFNFGFGGDLVIWEGKELVKNRFKHGDNLTTTALYLKENNTVLTSAYDSTIIWWNVDGSVKQKISHPGVAYSPFFFDNYQKLLSYDGANLYMWDTNGHLLKEISHSDFILSFHLLKNDDILVLTADNKAIIRDNKGGLIKEIQVVDSPSLYVYIPPLGDYFILFEKDKHVRIYNLKGELLQEIDGKDGDYIGINFSENGQYFLLNDGSNKVSLWNKEGRKIWSKPKSDKIIFLVRIFKNKDRIVMSYGDGVIHVFNLRGELIQEWVGHKGPLYDFVYSKDGSKVLTCSGDATAKLWTKDGQLLADFIGHEARVSSAQFSPDEEWILTTSADGSVMKWPMPSTYIEWIENLNLPPFTEEQKRFFGID